MTNIEYWLWLSNVEGMWQGKISKLIGELETPERIYKATKKELETIAGLSEKDVYNIINSKKKFDTKKEMENLRKNGITFITYDCDNYPQKLKNIYQPPYFLYVKGSLPQSIKSVSIVGARACSRYGIELAKRIGMEMADLNVDVISGMARGIDTYAHIGALAKKGRTYAVLGCGVDVCYPTENIELYERICKEGGIISEFPPGTRPDGWRFPQRNRIISGLCDCVVVIEARQKSGSLITVENALEQGKDVIAVPGRINDELSMGCNMLIRDGANILTKMDDIANLLGICKKAEKEKINNVLEKDFEVVYSETDLAPVSLEELVTRTGMSAERVYEIILKLQMKKLIYEPVKNYYARRPQ